MDGSAMRLTDRSRIDRVAGRIYSRVAAVVLGFISMMLFGTGLVHRAWAGMAGAWMWFGGAAFFAAFAALCWRSRAALSDIDFTS
jgi:hypothetical protein